MSYKVNTDTPNNRSQQVAVIAAVTVQVRIFTTVPLLQYQVREVFEGPP